MNTDRPPVALVLTAGNGTGMGPGPEKVLREFCGRSMLGHVLAAVRGLQPERLLVLADAENHFDVIAAHVAAADPDSTTVGEPLPDVVRGLSGNVLIVHADAPLLRTRTLAKVLREHARASEPVTVLAPEAAVCIADSETLASALPSRADAAGTDTSDAASTDADTGVAGLADRLRERGHRVGIVEAGEAGEGMRIGDQVQLADAHARCNRRLLREFMLSGVRIVDPGSTWVEVGVTLEAGAEILPWTQLTGRTTVAAGARVGPGCSLNDTAVAEDATVRYTVSDSARIGAAARVGPFAHLRPGTSLGPGSKAGSYVEFKNASLGAGSSAGHLTYVGDAEIGQNTNIGGFTAFANYDGVAKHRSRVGDFAQIGASTVLVAPVVVGDGAYTSAGTVITVDVPPGTLAAGRGRQRNLRGWVARRKAGTPAADAARASSRSTRANGCTTADPAAGEPGI